MENPAQPTAFASQVLERLCTEFAERPVGSAGNRAASAYFAALAAEAGWQVEQAGFTCMDWSQDGAVLEVDGQAYPVQVSPYSAGGVFEAELAAVSTLAELEAADVAGNILLVRGELAQEQLMPKNFAFYNPPEHQRIIRWLEEKQPAAIIAATVRSPETAGALYPFPLIEDGDFDIPSVYTDEETGGQIELQAGKLARLTVRAARTPAAGCNVIARAGAPGGPRLVFTAHIDAKTGTPGALDNGASVTTLLLLARLLAQTPLRHSVELVAINGEDYYAASGEMLFLEQNQDRFDEIALAVNMDGLGYRDALTEYSLYNCSEDLAALIRAVFSGFAGLREGEPWYQSDHGMFAMRGRPALALTSAGIMDLMARYFHTAQDTPALVDPARLVEAAHALRDLVLRLDARLAAGALPGQSPS